MCIQRFIISKLIKILAPNFKYSTRQVYKYYFQVLVKIKYLEMGYGKLEVNISKKALKIFFKLDIQAPFHTIFRMH